MWPLTREGGPWEGRAGGRAGEEALSETLDALRLALARPFEVPRTHAMRRGEEVRVEYARVLDSVYSSFVSEYIASGERVLSLTARLPQCVCRQHVHDAAITGLGLSPTRTQAAPPSLLPAHIATPRALRGLASGTCRLRLVSGMVHMCAVPTSLFGQDPHSGCRYVPRPLGSAARALPPCQLSHKKASATPGTMPHVATVRQPVFGRRRVEQAPCANPDLRTPCEKWALFHWTPTMRRTQDVCGGACALPASTLLLLPPSLLLFPSFALAQKQKDFSTVCFFLGSESVQLKDRHDGRHSWQQEHPAHPVSAGAAVSLSLSASLCVHVLFCLFRPRSVCRQSCGVGPPPTRTRGPGQARGCGSAVAVNAGGHDAVLAVWGPSCVHSVAGSPAGHAGPGSAGVARGLQHAHSAAVLAEPMAGKDVAGCRPPVGLLWAPRRSGTDERRWQLLPHQP